MSEEARLNIAVWHNLPTGGGLRALRLHVRGLTARGHHVEVWKPSTAAELGPDVEVATHVDASDRRALGGAKSAALRAVQRFDALR